VFLVIWHSVYAGAYQNEAAAMQQLQSVDRLHLLDWLDTRQQERDLWQRRFRSLYSDMQYWHEYDRADDKEKFLARPFPYISKDFQKSLEDDDSFLSILQRHKFPVEEEGRSFL